MYLVSVFYDENLEYEDIEDIIDKEKISHNKMYDRIDVNEYTKFINELNEEIDGKIIYTINRIT